MVGEQNTHIHIREDGTVIRHSHGPGGNGEPTAHCQLMPSDEAAPRVSRADFHEDGGHVHAEETLRLTGRKRTEHAEHSAVHEDESVHTHTDGTIHEHVHADGTVHSHAHADGSVHSHTHADGTVHEHVHADGTVHDHAHEEEEELTHIHTHGGHPHVHTNTKAVLNRISRAIGHLESIKRMVEDGRDCSEVLIQLSAVKSAINNTGKVILQDHIEHCIVDAVESGDREVLIELEKAIDRFIK